VLACARHYMEWCCGDAPRLLVPDRGRADSRDDRRRGRNYLEYVWIAGLDAAVTAAGGFRSWTMFPLGTAIQSTAMLERGDASDPPQVDGKLVGGTRAEPRSGSNAPWNAPRSSRGRLRGELFRLRPLWPMKRDTIGSLADAWTGPSTSVGDLSRRLKSSTWACPSCRDRCQAWKNHVSRGGAAPSAGDRGEVDRQGDYRQHRSSDRYPT
jgi:hypothetical protein